MSAQATAMRILGLLVFGGIAVTGLGYFWAFSASDNRRGSRSSLRQNVHKPGVDFRILIHGGAGVIGRGIDSKPFYDALSNIIKDVTVFARSKGSQEDSKLAALDIVEYAVRLLEDEPLFNAGRGAVFTSDETHELEASIMDGRTLKCGAVSMVSRVKNPISLARVVMETTAHNYLVGEGAEKLALQASLEVVDPSYFSTENRRDQLRRAKLVNKSMNDHDLEKEKADDETQENKPRPEAEGDTSSGSALAAAAAAAAAMKSRPVMSAVGLIPEAGGNGETKFVTVDDPPGGTGTVGAVCMYKGHIAAATSTGGLTNKMPGRIGDSPLIGAGTYANDATCAVSATGKGEEFMRHVAAYDVSARIDIGHMDLPSAVKQTVHQKLPRESGGLIAINAAGDYAMEFNSKGMFRGVCDSLGTCYVGIWEEMLPVVVSATPSAVKAES